MSASQPHLPPEGEGGAQRRKGDASTEATESDRTSPIRPSGTFPLRGKVGRPWRRAALWLVILAVVFYATYGFANWLAAQRGDVGEVVFGWERHVPFVDWTIFPYWSINAFYGLSLFVCATRTELMTHIRRLLTAQVIAVSCFLLFPLRFTFAKPETSGFAGFMFESLGAFDKPFNQAPSLHIALTVILLEFYVRHATPAWRWVLRVWFVGIGISVLTTYQHHFIDIPTGALLGFFALWLWPLGRPSPLHGATFFTFPRLRGKVARSAGWGALHQTRSEMDTPRPSKHPPSAPAGHLPPQAGEGRSARRRLAMIYGAGAVLCAAIAFGLGSAWLWFLWGTVALGMVAAFYAAIGAEGFQKGADGQLSLAARALLLPYLAGAWLNSRLWTRRQPAPDHVADGVWIGRVPSSRDATAPPARAILDLSAELSGPRGVADYRTCPTLDLVSLDPSLLCRAADTIEALHRDGPVLVTCALGYGRSAAVIAAWLVRSGRVNDTTQALAMIRKARPRVTLDAAALARSLSDAVAPSPLAPSEAP